MFTPAFETFHLEAQVWIFLCFSSCPQLLVLLVVSKIQVLVSVDGLPVDSQSRKASMLLFMLPPGLMLSYNLTTNPASWGFKSKGNGLGLVAQTVLTS